MRLIARHILPIGLTSLALFGLVVVVTMPMVAVFLIDDDFVLTEYLLFVISAFGVSLGLTVVVLFPVAVLGEVLFQRTEHVIWRLPLGLGVIAGGIFMGYALVSASFLEAVGSWSGFILLMSGLFLLYWTLLWLEKVALLGGKKLFVAFANAKRVDERMVSDQLPLEQTDYF